MTLTPSWFHSLEVLKKRCVAEYYTARHCIVLLYTFKEERRFSFLAGQPGSRLCCAWRATRMWQPAWLSRQTGSPSARAAQHRSLSSCQYRNPLQAQVDILCTSSLVNHCCPGIRRTGRGLYRGASVDLGAALKARVIHSLSYLWRRLCLTHLR